MTSLVFIHGWAQSARVWFRQQRRFAGARFIHLPGHGGAPDVEAERDLASAWLDRLTMQLPEEPCILVGWSLGGMLALDLAYRRPERIAGLVLVGGTPCFVEKADWPYGCKASIFAHFSLALEAPEKERRRALSRFFTLMLHGDALPRRSFNELARDAVDRRHPPSLSALQQGLSLLAGMDLRAGLDQLAVPALIMHGENDAIVPAAAGRVLAERIAAAEWRAFADCGHAPFLTQPERFNDILEKWCEER